MKKLVLRAMRQGSGPAIALLAAGLISCSPSPSPIEPSASSNSSPAAVMPPPPPKSAFLGRISPDVFAKIKHLPVMAPAYIPANFVLADYRLAGSQSYSLLYRNPKNQCFAIEYYRQLPLVENTDGLMVQSFDSPAFGAAHDLYYSPANESKQDSQPLSQSSSQLFSQWLSNAEGSYRLAGAAMIAQNYPNQTPCQNVSLVEASKIVTSIADLTASLTE